MHRQRTLMVLPVIEAIRSDNMAYTLLSACPHQSVFPPNKLPMTMGGGIGGGGWGECNVPHFWSLWGVQGSTTQYLTGLKHSVL